MVNFLLCEFHLHRPKIIIIIITVGDTKQDAAAEIQVRDHTGCGAKMESRLLLKIY